MIEAAYSASYPSGLSFVFKVVRAMVTCLDHKKFAGIQHVLQFFGVLFWQSFS